MTGCDRQTVADLAVEHCGDADSMFGIMTHNDIEASSEVAGMELEEEEVSAMRAVDYIRTQASSPACAYEEDEDTLTTTAGTVEVTTEEFETITA